MLLVHDNTKVGSLINCAACYTRANEGYFSRREVEVAVPGAAGWEWGFE